MTSDNLDAPQFERLVDLARAKVEDMGTEGDPEDLKAVEAAEEFIDD